MRNRYPGDCTRCGTVVKPGEGVATKPKGRKRFVVTHDECGAVTPTYRGRCEDAPCCGHSECGFGPGSPGYGSYVGGSPYYGEDRY